MKNVLVTRDIVKVKFSGNGMIGILTEGTVCEAVLHPTNPFMSMQAALLPTLRMPSWSSPFTATIWLASI